MDKIDISLVLGSIISIILFICVASWFSYVIYNILIILKAMVIPLGIL